MSELTFQGNNYLTWRLSGLVNCEEPQLQCFLFGGAFKQHWKTSVGSVVGVLNPSPMNNKVRPTQLTFTVFVVVILGIGC